jgi:hypothetical protein
VANRITLAELPPPVRAIANAVTDAVRAGAGSDAAAFADAAGRLALADPEHVRLVLGAVVRLLLEDLYPDGVDGDDLRTLIAGTVAAASPWSPGLDPGVLVVVLSGALGVHEDVRPEGEVPPDDPWDQVPPRPSAAEVTRHALVLACDLLAAGGRPVRGYLETAFTEIAQQERTEQP